MRVAHSVLLCLVVLALALAGCQHSSKDSAETTSAPARADSEEQVEASARIEVTGVERQTIRGWGASVVGDVFVEPLVAPGDLTAAQLGQLDRLVFEEAGINLVRVFGPGYDVQYGNVGPARPEDPRFAFMQRVDRYGVDFMLTGADAPLSLKNGKSLAPGAEAAYADYLTDVLRLAEDETEVPFSYVAIANEPDNANALLTMSSEQAALVYKRLTERIISEGLDAEVVLGDNTGWGDAFEYARAQLSAPGVARRAVAIASHSYGGAANEKRAVAEAAASAGLDVWQTEWGTGCPDCPDDQRMALALEWSSQIATDLVEADVSAWFTFRAVADATHGPGDALIVRQRGHSEEPFYTTKRFDVFRHYSSVAPPGAVRLDVTREGTDAPAVAFRNGDDLALVVTNSGHSALRVAVDFGERTGTLSGRRTTQDQSFASLAPLRYDSSPVVVTLPGESVTTLTLR